MTNELITNGWDVLKWLVIALGSSTTAFFLYRWVQIQNQSYKENKEQAILNNLKTMIRGLNVTDANYDAIILELDQIEYLSQPATRLKDEFLKRFEVIAKKRTNNANQVSELYVKRENRIKELESVLAELAKDRMKHHKDFDAIQVTNVKENNIMIRLDELNRLQPVESVKVEKKRGRKAKEVTPENEQS
jgi:hypothetical protein